MLFGVGCDLCEVARMEKSLFGPHGAAFARRVFGPQERAALALDDCRTDAPDRKRSHITASAAAERASALQKSRRFMGSVFPPDGSNSVEYFVFWR